MLVLVKVVIFFDSLLQSVLTLLQLRLHGDLAKKRWHRRPQVVILIVVMRTNSTWTNDKLGLTDDKPVNPLIRVTRSVHNAVLYGVFELINASEQHQRLGWGDQRGVRMSRGSDSRWSPYPSLWYLSEALINLSFHCSGTFINWVPGAYTLLNSDWPYTTSAIVVTPRRCGVPGKRPALGCWLTLNSVCDPQYEYNAAPSATEHLMSLQLVYGTICHLPSALRSLNTFKKQSFIFTFFTFKACKFVCGLSDVLIKLLYCIVLELVKVWLRSIYRPLPKFLLGLLKSNKQSSVTAIIADVACI